MKKRKKEELPALYILTASKTFKVDPKIYLQVCFMLTLFILQVFVSVLLLFPVPFFFCLAHIAPAINFLEYLLITSIVVILACRVIGLFKFTLYNNISNFSWSYTFTGLTIYNNEKNTVKSDTQSRPSKKPTYPRSSTLMKPTASQLAKQNRPVQAGYSR